MRCARSGVNTSRRRTFEEKPQRHRDTENDRVTDTNQKIRVLIAKPGLDGHDRGAKVVARALRDGGMEVIYTGLRQTPEMIVAAAAQEDVDAIGLSILSGAHLPICRKVIELLAQKEMQDVRVFLGGIIPAQDIPDLKAMGVAEVFLPGASTVDVIRLIESALPARKSR
jgi:methylmalonyl-CoA mutase cobalamin-binding domain/chain